MTVFEGFSRPTQRIVMEHAAYRLEVWPELGGSIANFDRISPDGRVVHLFKPTPMLRHYLLSDLASWPLVPYSNRIAHGKFEFDGKKYTIPMNVPDHPHALHGIGWQRAWRTLTQDARNCHLRMEHTADKYWPFSFSAEQLFKLDDNGLILITSLTNMHDGPMPCGIGQHPHIVRPPGTKLLAQVDGVWLTDYTIMPVHYTKSIPGEWDLRKGCPLDGALMDNCFDGFRGDAEVIWPDKSRLIISGSNNLNFLVVYNSWKYDYVCVEPVTHSTDAINKAAQGKPDTGFQVLALGKTAETTHRFTYHAPSPV